MDDTTLVEVGVKARGSNMQSAADQVCKWSEDNELGLNTTKTKDMLISFGAEPDIPPLTMNNAIIERVKSSKLLGVFIQSNLEWDVHVNYLNAKCSTRLHFLRLLKRGGLTTSELTTWYIALIRQVCEYACPVWATGLTKKLSDTLESIQIRVCRIILPKCDYDNARETLKLKLLSERRLELCKTLFIQMQKPEHKLHHLLPKERVIPSGPASSIRNFKKYEPPKWKTKRFKNSFVPYCLYNFQ